MNENLTFEVKEYPENNRAKGVLRNETKHRDFLAQAEKSSTREAATIAPAKLDLSTKVSLPENQGGCGSCWAFGITKAFRSAYMLAGKDPGRLAFNFLLNDCGGVQEYGCNGGDFDAGNSFLKKAPWLESQDPYTQRDGGRCLTVAPACEPATGYKVVGDGHKMPTFKELVDAMYNNGLGRCLVVDVAAGSGSWSNYSDGIYNGNGSGIDHIINMVGYDMQTSVDADGNAAFNSAGMPVNGDGYLIVMNNWGESWGTKAGNGHGGYMFTRYGKNQIAETAMYFEVVGAPVPPTPPTPPTPPVPPTPPTPAPGGNTLEILLAIGVLVAIVLGVISLLK